MASALRDQIARLRGQAVSRDGPQEVNAVSLLFEPSQAQKIETTQLFNSASDALARLCARDSHLKRFANTLLDRGCLQRPRELMDKDVSARINQPFH